MNYIPISVFFIGSCLGSFFKLVVDRYSLNESFVFKPSYCLSCKNTIAWWQNIPIVSYLILKGKCFYCKHEIDINCFYSELVTAIIAFVVYQSALLANKAPLETILLLLFIMTLVSLSMFDLKHRIIPHEITYIGMFFLVVFQYFHKNQLDISFVNLAVAFLFMDFLYFFGTLIKRFQAEINPVVFPQLVWTIYFFFNQSVYFVFIPILIYFLFLRLKISTFQNNLFWLLLFSLFSAQIFKLIILEPHLSNLRLFLCGIGIIYFICEVVFYIVQRFVPYFKSQSLTSTTQSPILLGGGDITVFVLITLFLGYRESFLVLFLASLFGICSHLLIKLLGGLQKDSKKKHSEYLPFVPYMVLATLFIIIKTNVG